MELTSTRNTNLPDPIWPDLFADRFFGGRWPFMEPLFSAPPANVINNKNHFRIEVAAPGFSKDNFDIAIDDNVLCISAQKEEEKNEEDERYTRHEFSYSSFSRSFTLPENCEASKIEAGYEHGILVLEIPKKEKPNGHQKKSIRVK